MNLEENPLDEEIDPELMDHDAGSELENAMRMTSQKPS